MTSLGRAALIAFVTFSLLVAFIAGVGHAASSVSNFTTAVTGPTVIGESLKAKYTLTASGGPAQAANGSFVGTISYRATLAALNTSGSLVTPPSGVLINGTATVVVTAPNATETITLSVAFTSSYQGKNATSNSTLAVDVIVPYRLSATLVVGNTSVAPFNLTVTLDGVPVGSVAVPGLSAGSSYPVTFSYAIAYLAPGWHTFAISLAQLHGLVEFSGGLDVLTSSIFVPEPTPDYTLWYLAGTIAFFGAICIWSASVGARRRGRTKS